MRHGLDTLLPPHIQLLHGPGCPVCVTPARYLDQAIAIARQPDTIVTTFGDLLRVPSESSGDLFAAKAQGADVRIVTSPLQTLDIAQAHPEKNIVHLAIGFETTAPANAMLAFLAMAPIFPLGTAVALHQQERSKKNHEQASQVHLLLLRRRLRAAD